MMDVVELLFHDVGIELGIVLKPDHNSAAKIQIGQDIVIQLEYNKKKECISIMSFIAETPPGKFRENVLKMALRANDEKPRELRLGYSEKNNQLALFYNFSMEDLSKERLIEAIVACKDKVRTWRRAIETGSLSSLVSTPSSQKPAGLFGIK